MSQRFPEPNSGEGLVEEPVDARRYIEALRRHAALILGVAAGIAVLVLLISLVLPKSYTATARVAPSVQATQTAASGSTTTQVNLSTLQAYATSPTVLAAAAHTLTGESAASLQQKITASLDTGANIVNITAKDGDAARSAQLANGVATTFLSVRTAAEQAQLAQQTNSLTAKLQAATAAGSTGLAAALQQQISNIAAQEAGAGSDLQLLAVAAVPVSASSPRPTRNAFFAFIAVLFIGVLAVGARELLAPSVSGGRELSALMGMPILGSVPRVAGGQRVRRIATDKYEAEAYRFLAKSLELAAWPSRSRLVAVTSAARCEGKTTVVSRLGAACAETGSRTLLVSADLRWPALDAVFGLPPDDGLGTVLTSQNGSRGTGASSHIERVQENLYVLPSGPPPTDPAAVLTSDIVASLFERLRELDFEYVLFDLPPLTAAAETQLFVRHSDATVLASMVGHANAEQLSQTRELLSRIAVGPAGIVLLGVRAGAPRTAPRRLGQPDRRGRPEEDRASFAPAPRPPVSHDAASGLPASFEPNLPELDLEPIHPAAMEPISPAPSPPPTSRQTGQRAAGRRPRQKAASRKPPSTTASSDAPESQVPLGPQAPPDPQTSSESQASPESKAPPESQPESPAVPQPTRSTSRRRTPQKPGAPEADAQPLQTQAPPDSPAPTTRRAPRRRASKPEPPPPK